MNWQVLKLGNEYVGIHYIILSTLFQNFCNKKLKKETTKFPFYSPICQVPNSPYVITICSFLYILLEFLCNQFF